MKPIVNVTYEMDDYQRAVQELLKDVPEHSSAHKVGILFCYSDMEVQELAAALHAAAGFDIIGCTGIATMDQAQGFHDMAATLMVLSADNSRFSVAVSEPIRPDNVLAQTEAAYRSMCAALPAEPQLLVCLPPYLLEIMLDEYSNAFNRIAPGIPVVGGLPSFNASGDQNVTILNGAVYADRLVLLGISGPLRPVFSVQNVGDQDSERKRRVTEARGNVIYRVGDQSFTDYLKEMGLPVENLTQGNNTITFVSNPLLLENASDSGETYAFARTLHEINLEEGSGTAIGQIPEGAMISICSLQRGEIEKAAQAGIRALKEKMKAAEAEGYRYSTVLAVSCIGRHLLMLPNNDAEVKNLLSEFPPGLVLAGFYSYGEIGPQGAEQNKNFAHNESLVLCCF